jgi:hypothetical protein
MHYMPICYDIIAIDPATKRWNVLFYHDERGDRSDIGVQNVRTFGLVYLMFWAS